MKGITPRILQKPYNDKLRVYKPCYSDVIIYLSDDSSSANDSDGEKVISAEEIEVPKTKAEDLLVPNLCQEFDQCQWDLIETVPEPTLYLESHC